MSKLYHEMSKPYHAESSGGGGGGGELATSCSDGWNASTTPAVAAGNSTSPVPLIWVVTFKLDNEVDNVVYLVNFWIQALLVKLLPCCGLTVLSALLRYVGGPGWFTAGGPCCFSICGWSSTWVVWVVL